MFNKITGVIFERKDGPILLQIIKAIFKKFVVMIGDQQLDLLTNVDYQNFDDSLRYQIRAAIYNFNFPENMFIVELHRDINFIDGEYVCPDNKDIKFFFENLNVKEDTMYQGIMFKSLTVDISQTSWLDDYSISFLDFMENLKNEKRINSDFEYTYILI